VLGIFASQEQWINPGVVETFELNMKKAKGEVRVYNFDADHAFANPSSPRYQETAAQEAYVITLEYLTKKFK
jgi:carboxymethylenebutenolidase